MSGKSPRSHKSRKRRPSGGDGGASDGDVGDFDYELERPQKVPLLTAQEEARRNLRLLADMRLTGPDGADEAAAAEEAGQKFRVVEFGDVDMSGDDSPGVEAAKGHKGGRDDTVEGGRRSGKKKSRDKSSRVPSNGLDDAIDSDSNRGKKKSHDKSDRVLSNGLDNVIDKGSNREKKESRDKSVSVPSDGLGNGPSNGLDINRNEAGGQSFAFAFDFGEGELNLDAEIVESADVDFAAVGAEFGDAPAADGGDEDAGVAARSRRRQTAGPPGASEFHPFNADTRPGLDFFAQRPDPEGAEFIDNWRRERDFIKADVVRTWKRAAAAKKHGAGRSKATQ